MDIDSHSFERLHPGRRIVVDFPIKHFCTEVASLGYETISVAVLDSAETGDDGEVNCAALLVPKGKGGDWVYCSEGGQWQLLASVGASRIVIVQRNWLSPADKESICEVRKGGIGCTWESDSCSTNAERHQKHRGWEKNERKTERKTVPCGDMARMAKRVKVVSKSSSQINSSMLVTNAEVKDSLGRKSCQGSNCDDEALETRLHPLVVALAPRICFRNGIPTVPFVLYTDNVVRRVVVEEAYSPLTGLMVVEDVALEDHETEVPNLEIIQRRNYKSLFRRRLRFKRMPNLIQTEVPLIFPHHPCEIMFESRHSDLRMSETITPCSSHLTRIPDTKICNEATNVFCGGVMSGAQVDHNRLVHKYLAPIVAGFVLAAPCIDSCMDRGEKVKVMALGVGGGALPVFLHKHFGFHVQAVDVDKVVLDLASRHFGLKNCIGLEVKVGDALQTISELAAMVVHSGNPLDLPLISSPKAIDTMSLSATKLSKCKEVIDPTCLSEGGEGMDKLSRTSSTNESGLGSSCSVNCIADDVGKLSSVSDLCDHRVHIMVVDVDEGDARLGLSSPPSTFLEPKFLTGARAVLHKGGLLAMNVIPNGAKSYRRVVSALLCFFDEIYEAAVEGDVNRVLFALPSKGTGLHLDGPLASLVKATLDVKLLSGIHRVGIDGFEAF